MLPPSAAQVKRPALGAWQGLDTCPICAYKKPTHLHAKGFSSGRGSSGRLRSQGRGAPQPISIGDADDAVHLLLALTSGEAREAEREREVVDGLRGCCPRHAVDRRRADEPRVKRVDARGADNDLACACRPVPRRRRPRHRLRLLLRLRQAGGETRPPVIFRPTVHRRQRSRSRQQRRAEAELQVE
ncbi:hypothetical protein PVAP13_3NG079703 [Panicum virgatum]|uniref:Uncharacterized protein n=1 Tax=Panicum virgatum TaxID=38727 RepID=A0A8T0UC49_PANVG|nr:hypothetical protein PVAP13_3NG079703 [Panicum virgatum]